MKKKFRIAYVTIFLSILFLSNNSFSQIPGVKINRKVHSKEEQRIEAEIKAARESGDKNTMLQLQNNLDEIAGSDSKPGDPYPGTFVFVNEEMPLLDSPLDITEISSINGMRALATATEQRGTNVGRIWTAVAISNSNSRDTIYYYKSDNNGVSWTLYGYLSLGNSDEVNYDQMDLEIIENTSGDKYLWTVYGLTASNGKQFVGYCTLRTTGFSAGLGAIAWPSENYSNTNVGHFRPRITSDNAKYLGAARIYISASEDSLGIDFIEHVGKICYVRCVDPYTTSPVFSSFKTYDVAHSGSITIATDIISDIAYLNSYDDNIITVITNVNHYDSLIGLGYLALNFDVTEFDYAAYGNVYDKQFARVASSGGTNQYSFAIVYRENYQNSGDWDIKSLYTENWGIDFISKNIDVTRDANNIPQPPDIVARRGVDGKFSVAYTINGTSFNSVKYTKFYNSGLFYSHWTAPETMNHVNGALRPKPGIKYSDNDSCFCIWSGSGGNNIWASSGCNDVSISTLNLSALIQGLYNSSSNTMVKDTVNVYLRNSTSPYSRIDSSKGVLNSSGTGTFNFSNAVNNVNYYIVIKHRNSIETWSSSGNAFISGNLTYSFLTASNKAYGNNQIQVDTSPLRFAIYSGDVNQEGNVDLADLITVYNGASNFLTGYKVTDLNGDNITDLSDLVIAYNNSSNFISKIRP